LKKTFKDTNPALSFISAPGGAYAPDPRPSGVHHEDTDTNTDNYTDNDTDIDTDADTYTYTPRPRPRREARTRRMQILLRPSLYAALARIAEESGQSVNETIHGALERFAKGHGTRG